MPRRDNQAASEVPKKAEGLVLRSTNSPATGCSCGTIWLSGASSRRARMGGTLSAKMLASAPSSWYTTRVCTIGHWRWRAWERSPRVHSMAGPMLPPPNVSGSAKPLMKSMINRP
ncbi:hypothetical protein D3C87_1824610 [compost metagenome]